jgi:hypothetical protein
VHVGEASPWGAFCLCQTVAVVRGTGVSGRAIIKKALIIIIILLAFATHLRVLACSFLRFRDHTQGCTTVGRTPLDD